MKMKKFCSVFCLLLICLFTSTMFVGCKKAKTLTAEMVTLEQTSYFYDGTEKKPNVTVTVDGKVVDKKNYSVTYLDNINAGQATARIVSAKKSKKISGSVDIHFEILGISYGSITPIENKIYNGQNQVPNVDISGYTLGVDYTLSWQYKVIGANDSTYVDISGTEFINAGVYRVTATGIGNYSGEKTATYTIEKASHPDVSVSRASFEYLSPSEIVLSENVNGGVKYFYSANENFDEIFEFDSETNFDVGTYYFYAEIEESQNYNSLKTSNSSFSVTPFDLANAQISLSQNSFDYTGLAIKPKPEVVCAENVVLVENRDYTLSYTRNIEIGTANLTITGVGNFTGTNSKNFQIVKSSNPCEKHTPNSPVVENLVRATPENDGGYDLVTYCSICGEEISRDYHKINKIDVLNFSLESDSYFFTGSLIEPIVLSSQLENGKDFDVSYENNTAVGTAKVVLTFKGNYSGTYEISFSIKKAQVDVPEIVGTYYYTGIEQSATLNNLCDLFEVKNNVGKNAGSYKIIVALNDTENYEWKNIGSSENIELDFVILKAKVNKPVIIGSYSYTGAEQTATVIPSSKLYDVSGNKATNVGTYDVKISLKDKENYEWSGSDSSDDLTLKFTISKCKVVEPTIVGEYVYNGSEQTASLSNESDLFVVSGITATNVGTYRVVVSLKDKSNYEWKTAKNSNDLELNFEIKKASIENLNVSVEQIDFTFTGNEIKPLVNIEFNGKSLTLNDDFSVVYQNNINRGTATIVITGIGNFDGTVTKTFEILKCKVVEPTIVGTYTYNGESQSPEFSYKSNLFVVEDKTYVNAGEYNLRVSLNDKSNYYWENSGKSDDFNLLFKIQKFDLSNANIELDKTFFDYTGSEVIPNVVVKINEKTLSQNDDYILKLQNNINVGVADVIVSGIGNFTGQAISHFTIGVQGVLEPTIVGEYIYNGSNQTAKLSYSSDYFTVSNATHKNAGTYSVVVSLKDKENHIWSNSKNNEDLILNFKIQRLKVLEPKIVGNYTYTGEEIIPIFENESDDYVINETSIINAGEYYLTVSLKDQANFEWSEKGDNENLLLKLVVNQIEVEEPTIVGTYIYDGTEKTANLSYRSDYFTVSGDKQTYSGTYQVIVSLVDKLNFKWKSKQDSEDLSLNFTIGYNDFASADVQIEEGEFIYTGSEIEPEVAVKFAGKELSINFDFKVEYLNNINSGTATIVITGLNNYSGTITKTFEILKAKLVKPSIVGTYIYNGENQTAKLSYKNSSLIVDNETAKNAGTYYVSVKISDKANFVWEDNSSDDLSLEFVILKASVTEPKIVGNYVYNGKEQIVMTDYESDLFEISENKATNVGVYYANVVLTDKVNYKWKNADNSNDLTLKFEIFVYEVEEPVIKTEYDYTGNQIVFLAENEFYNVTNGSGINAGTYKVVVALKDKTNYVWKETQNTENLSYDCYINVVDLSNLAVVTLEYEEIVFTGNEFTPSILSVVVSGRTLTESDYDFSYSDNINVGSAKVTITGKGNYKGTAEKTFKIKPAEVLQDDITLSAESVVYNGLNQLPDVIVKFGGKVLEKNIDYTIIWKDSNKNLIFRAIYVGQYSVTITGINNFTFTATRTFEITKAVHPKVYTFVEDTYIGLNTIIGAGNEFFGEVNIYYKNVNDKNYISYTDEIVLPVGKYEAYTVVEESYNYFGTQSDVVYFEVKKYDRGNVSISKDSYILGNETETMIWNYDENDIVLYYYKSNQTEEDAVVYDNSTKFDVGKYYIFAIVPETDTYYEFKTTTESFEVYSKVYENDITISRENYTYAGEKSETIISGYDGDLSKVHLYYSSFNQDYDGELYTDSDELDAGFYYIYAVIEPQNGYGEYTTAVSSFEIYKGNYFDIFVSMDSAVYGESLTMPTLSKDIQNSPVYYYNKTASKEGAKAFDISVILDCGTYYIYAMILESQNYNYYETEISSFAISKKVVFVPVIQNVTYNGSSQTALIETDDYVVSNETQINAGIYDVTISLKDKLNFKWEDETSEDKILKFTIEQLDIGNCTFEIEEQEFVYDGKEKKPEVTIKFNDDILPNFEYELSYSNNINSGTAKIIVTASKNGNFKSYREIEFSIQKANYENILVLKPSHNYGSTQKTSLSADVYGEIEYFYNLENSNENGTKFDDLTVFNAGTYYIYAVISESENYFEFKTETSVYEVYKLDLNLAEVTLENDVYYVTGFAIEPVVLKVKVDEIELEIEDYIVSYENNINFGTGRVIITAVENSNFSGSTSKEFEILKLSIEDASVEFENGQTEYDYNGDFITPNVAVKLNGSLLTENVDYTISYDNNMNIGTATITITGIGNYSSVITENFEIVGSGLENAKVYFSVNGNEKTTHSLSYSGSSKKSVVEKLIKVEIGGNEISDYKVEWYFNNEIVKSVVNVGTYTIVITENENGSFTGTATTTLTFKITQKKITNVLTVNLTESELSANGNNLIESIGVLVQTDELRENIDYSIVWKNESGEPITEIVDAGVYTAEITILSSGNYSYSKTITKTLTVI